MTRPADVPDPRAPDSPLRLADPTEDAARSRTTVGQLARGYRHRGRRVRVVALDLTEVDPARLAQLRPVRDRILAALRERRGYISDAHPHDLGGEG